MRRRFSGLLGSLLLALVFLLPGAVPLARASGPSGLVVTRADNGRTLHLSVGDTFLLKLGGPPPDWTIRISNPAVLQRQVNILVVRGAQGVYRAIAPGTAVLTAAGTYPCMTAKPPCDVPTPLVRVRVVVSAAVHETMVMGTVTAVAGDEVTLFLPPVRPFCPPGTVCPQYVLAGRPITVETSRAEFFNAQGAALGGRVPLAVGETLVVSGTWTTSTPQTLMATGVLLVSTAAPATSGGGGAAAGNGTGP
jgi:hypothetical protein